MTALSYHLSRHIIDEPSFACSCGWVAGPDDTWPDHVAAAWQEHRTVTTVKDGLDLPDGTVLRDAEGEVHLLHAPSPTPISLPATIIFHPEEDQ